MTTKKDVHSVLIVEDHVAASKVLEAVCMETFASSDVIFANTIATAKVQLAARDFDLALLDIGLPDGNGVELIAEIKKTSPDTRCVMTTIFDDDEHLFHALRAGADGYLIKGHSAAELKAFLVDAINGKLALSSNIADSILTFFRDSNLKNEDPSQSEGLTEREREILQLIAKGCQVKEVSQLLSIAGNTVSHHIKSIYSKLNIHNRAEATAAAINLDLYHPD